MSPNILYPLSDADSRRIQIWRLWMVLLMPLNHIYTTPNRTGGTVSAAFFEPDWLEAIQHVLVKIVSRCVPSAFALIAAVLLFRKPFLWKENLQRKCRTLLVPLFLLTGFWVAVYAVGPQLPFIGGMFSSGGTMVADWSPRQWIAAFLGWTNDHQMPTILYPLWFLRDLMLMNLIAPLIKRSIDRFALPCLAVLAAMLVWNTDSVFFYRTVHQVFIFFCLGYYIVKYDFHFSDLDKVPAKWISLGYVASIAMAYLLRDYADSFGAVRGIPNLMGVLFFARVVSRLPRSSKWQKRFLWLSEYSIAVFLFHERMLSFAKRLLLRLLPAGLGTSLFMFYAVPMLVTAICICIGWFLRKTQPGFYRLVTGGR